MGRFKLARIALGALIATTAAGAISAQSGPRAEPLRETIHGITLDDEYRWMEDPTNRDEMLAFVNAENARTRTMLDALPERAWFADRLKAISSSLARISGYARCGDLALIGRIGAADRVAKLYFRDAAGERLWLDPAKVTGVELSSFGAVAFAPDCKRASVQVSTGGGEAGTTMIYDLATGQQVGAPIARIWGQFPVAFTPDGHLLYTQMAETTADRDPMTGMTTHLVSSAGTDTIILGDGQTVRAEDFPIVVLNGISPWAIGAAAGARADNEFYLSSSAAVLAGKPAWRSIATLADKVGWAAAIGDSLYLITSKTNSAGDIVRRSIAADGALGTAELVLEGRPDLLLKDIHPTREGLYVSATRDGASRLMLLPVAGGQAREMVLPFEGSILALEPDADGSGASLLLSGWNEGARILRVEDGVLTDTGMASEVWEGAARMTTMRFEATSDDGTKVPLVVQRRKGATGRVPTIVEAYGGYGADTTYPAYDRNGMAWLDKGGAMAFCGTRGGGERGRDWHEGGRGANKPRAMEDLAACARELVARGIAPAKGPLITGASMGGTLVPTAAARFPGRFGGMMTSVGVMNATRIAQAENGANQFAEMGNPADPAQFKDLAAMDAYQLLQSADHLPPSLLMIGLNDKRVVPWMTAKWFARARAKWPHASLWLRADGNSGHGIGSGEDVRRDQSADFFAFAWNTQTLAE